MTQVASNAHRVEIIASSALDALLSTMSSGQTASLTTNGNTPSLFYPDGPLYSYTQRGTWNPIRQCVHLVGGTHGTQYINRHVYYDVVSNTWINDTTFPIPSGVANLMHAFHHATVNKVTGALYHRRYGARTFLRQQTQGAAWDSIADQNATASIQQVGSIDWADYFSASGGIGYYDGDWGIAYWNGATNTWALVDGTVGLMGSYNTVSAWNGEDNRVYGGGGSSNRVHRINANGTRTEVVNAPFQLSSDPLAGGTLLGPVVPNGKMLCFGTDSTMREYNYLTNSWSAAVATLPSAIRSSESFFLTPIPEKGCALIVHTSGSDSLVKVWKR
jgi:hypothetical protein